jgi:hypothetical protein
MANYYVNSVLGLLHRVDMGDVADVSEMHAAFILKVEVHLFL